MEEVMATISNLKAEGAPMPDGLPVFFFKVDNSGVQRDVYIGGF